MYIYIYIYIYAYLSLYAYIYIYIYIYIISARETQGRGSSAPALGAEKEIASKLQTLSLIYFSFLFPFPHLFVVFHFNAIIFLLFSVLLKSIIYLLYFLYRSFNHLLRFSQVCQETITGRPDNRAAFSAALHGS